MLQVSAHCLTACVLPACHCNFVGAASFTHLQQSVLPVCFGFLALLAYSMFCIFMGRPASAVVEAMARSGVQMFGPDAPPLPWDTAGAYRADSVCLYYCSNVGTILRTEQIVQALQDQFPSNYVEMGVRVWDSFGVSCFGLFGELGHQHVLKSSNTCCHRGSFRPS